MMNRVTSKLRGLLEESVQTANREPDSMKEEEVKCNMRLTYCYDS